MVVFVRVLGTVVIASLASCGGRTAPPAPPPTTDATIQVEGATDWVELPALPTPRSEVTAATDGDRIFLIGGMEAAQLFLRTVEVFDPVTQRWTEGPDLPLGAHHAMSAGLDGAIYVFGGYSERTGTALVSDYAYILQGGAWEQLPDMPEPRAEGGAAAVDGKLYVVGGVGLTGLAETTMVCDPATSEWSTTTGLLTPRNHLGVAAADGRIFAIGGRDAPASLPLPHGGFGSQPIQGIGASEVFDPATEEWTELPELPTPRGGLGAAATSNGFIVTAGGEAREETDDEVEALDVQSSEWAELPPISIARHGLGVVAIDTVVYVIAGGTVPGLSASAVSEAIDVAALEL